LAIFVLRVFEMKITANIKDKTMTYVGGAAAVIEG
jgi:hypothetical protein